ncbi:MAG: tetratricopeptide repeat protein [Ignavibacteria bacterium]|nr:tetratricopeptide repeat protein [Ignavibacteria bacterium]MCU7502092.1 tetratricopeptide repeat protein [Ignavibacteria bacterium]MCU7515494.1 tetratricopeptide repeat protein [Ignavibacteria bacterium]
MRCKFFIPVFILALFPLTTLPAQDSAKSGPYPVNSFLVLNSLALDVGDLERQYAGPGAKSIIQKSNGLCSVELADNSGSDFDTMLVQIEKISIPGDVLAVYSSISNDFMPEITFSEAGFHILNAVQKRLEVLFQSLRSDKKLVNMAVFATSNLEISRIKTRLVRRQIRILSECEEKEERLRCWLAVKRMLDEIDIPKSESGDLAVQNSPYGIALLPGEILSKLKPLSENESDENIRMYSAGVLKALEVAPSKYREGTIQIALNELSNFNPKDRLINPGALELFHKADSTAGIEGKIALYTEAIKMDPKFTAAYSNRGSCYYELENYEKAEKDFQKALELDPGHYTLYKYLANCRYKTGCLEDAVKNFSEALKYEITDTLLVNRGVCYMKLGQLKAAVLDFSSAIRFNAGSLPARINRVQCYLTMKQYDEAANDYRKLILLQPKNSSHYYNLGCLYSIQKDWEKVVSTWEQGLLVNPGDENIRKNLPKAKANLNNETGK